MSFHLTLRFILSFFVPHTGQLFYIRIPEFLSAQQIYFLELIKKLDLDPDMFNYRQTLQNLHVWCDEVKPFKVTWFSITRTIYHHHSLFNMPSIFCYV